MMNINSIPAQSATNSILNNDLQPQISYLNKPICDKVSFSGHKQEVQEDNFTEKQLNAIQVSKKLSKLARSNTLTAENITSILSQNSPVPVEVCDIKDAPNNIQETMGGKVLAHMLPGYNPTNFQLAHATIYVNLDEQTNNKETNALIANIAHEYTHVLQRAEDKNYYSMTNYTKDASKIVPIAREAQGIMQGYLGTCGRTIFANPQRTRAILYSRLQNPNSIKSLTPKINLRDAIADRANTLSQYFGQDMPVENCMKKFVLQEAQNELEAYKVTEQVLKNSGKYDEMTFAKCLLSEDLHQNIVDMLK